MPMRVHYRHQIMSAMLQVSSGGFSRIFFVFTLGICSISNSTFGNPELEWLRRGPSFRDMEVSVFTELGLPGRHEATQTDSVVGCMDDAACNFDVNATVDNGTCCYGICGSLNMFSENGTGWLGGEIIIKSSDGEEVLRAGLPWNGSFESAQVDFCLQPGCYSIQSSVPGEGAAMQWSVTLSEQTWVGGGGVLPTSFSVGEVPCVSGCTIPVACNYNPVATWLSSIEECDFVSCLGCTYPQASNFNSGATYNDGSCIFSGCMDPQAANFNPMATLDDGTCIVALASSVCSEDVNGDGYITVSDLLALLAAFGQSCPGVEVFGCTDDLSCNFNPSATQDDGSCLELDACGVCGGSGIPTGACDCGGNVLDACGDCGGQGLDTDGDGVCDEAEVPGCTDASACNYLTFATEDDGSCEQFDECGICGGMGIADGACDCQGNVPDECGICGGTGIPSGACNCEGETIDPCGECGGEGLDTDGDGVCDTAEVLGCTDTTASNYNESATEENGSCTYGPAQCSGQSNVTFDGFSYELVGIGDQCWFKENLRSDNYRNGDAIPGNLSNSQWGSSTSGAFAIYGNLSSNVATYGHLYNGFAMLDSRGLCPTGFHVPNDEEWWALENHLGGTAVAGGKLKSAPSDQPPWDGSNSSGFSGLPGGYRFSYDGLSYYAGQYGFWWSSSTLGTTQAWYRALYSDQNQVIRDQSELKNGYSVRCVLDDDFVCADSDSDGVCDAFEVLGCTDPNAANYDPLATEDNEGCLFAPAQCNGQLNITYDGYTYELVGIGNQCWFKENLRTDQYRNGTAIPGNLTNSQWSTTLSGAQNSYSNNATNLANHGRLYNGYAVTDSRGLCPVGFHVSSDLDWTELGFFLGGASLAGLHIKSSSSDTPPWDGTNSTGFGATPTGYRSSSGSYSLINASGYYWTSTGSGSFLLGRWMNSGNTSVYVQEWSKRFGYAVRCVMDQE